jgi:hypothetical protein
MAANKITTLTKKATEVENAIEELAAKHQALVAYAERALVTTNQALEEERRRSLVQGLNMVALRDVLCSDMNAVEQVWVPAVIGTLGSGPWEEQEFDFFLQDRGIEPVEAPAQAIEALIVGASGWDEDVLSEQIYDRDSNTLRIYTQELFVVGLILNQDPYDALDQAAIDAVAAQHPAIQFLLDRDFAWPTGGDTDADGWQPDRRALDQIDWAKESVLKLMGYSVRAGGPDIQTRREVLKQTFESTSLPGLRDPRHARQWGASRSSQRLNTMAEFLRWLISFQGVDKPEARERWQADLEWLKTEFYEPTMRFEWPISDGEIPPATPAAQVTLDPSVAWPFPLAQSRSLR